MQPPQPCSHATKKKKTLQFILRGRSFLTIKWLFAVSWNSKTANNPVQPHPGSVPLKKNCKKKKIHLSELLPPWLSFGCDSETENTWLRLEDRHDHLKTDYNVNIGEGKWLHWQKLLPLRAAGWRRVRWCRRGMFGPETLQTQCRTGITPQSWGAYISTSLMLSVLKPCNTLHA